MFQKYRSITLRPMNGWSIKGALYLSRSDLDENDDNDEAGGGESHDIAFSSSFFAKRKVR